MTSRLRSALLRALPRRRRRTGGVDVHRDLALRALAIDRQLDIVADAGQADYVAQLGPAAHRDTIDRDDQIAAVKAGLLGRGAGIDAGDYCPRGVRGTHRLREIRGQVLDRDADPAALHLAIANELVHDPARHVDRHGKADPDIAAARRQDGRVDADAFAQQVDERAPELPGLIDASVWMKSS